MDNISVIEVKPQRVIGLRQKGSYRLIAELFPRLFQFAMENNIQIAGHPLFICHEITKEEVKKADAEGTADVEVAVPIAGDIEGSGDIACYELPGGKMVKTIHKGPYHACEPTYDKLYKWINENGKKICGPVRETYLNSPAEVSEEELITEIFAPIE